MDRVVKCPLDGVELMPAAAARHVGQRHPHLLPAEQVALVKFLGGLK
jgi:hypothetical protein